jgi:prevent-host-death family protein
MTEQLGNRRMTASEVRQHFSAVVNSVARGEGRVIVEKNGSPAVAIVSLGEIVALNTASAPEREAELARRRDVLAELRALFEDVDPDEFQKDMDQLTEEIYAERQRQRDERKAARVSSAAE